MQIQFSRQGKRVNTYSDLCKPQLSVSPPANRLVLCDRVNSCSGVEARRPGRSTLPICCSDSLAVSPNSARNLMSILLPSVCTALPFDSRLWKTFSELSPPQKILSSTSQIRTQISDFRFQHTLLEFTCFNLSHAHFQYLNIETVVFFRFIVKRDESLLTVLSAG